MQTFLFVAGLGGDFRRYLETLSVSAASFIPGSGGGRSAAIQILPEVTGGWVTWTPEAPPALMSDQDVQEDLAILSFGDLADGSPLARSAAHAFRKGGANAVRNLNGTFSAIIIERKERRIQVLTDRIGRLATSCWLAGERLHVTVHEALLGVCGCPFELDPVSVASILGCGWSISGVPLNRQLVRIDGRRTVTWANGEPRVGDLPIFGPGTRIAPENTRDIEDVIKSMCETVTQAAQTRAQRTLEVEAGLTAGFDSRAVLAALVAGFKPHQIKLYTTGTEDSRDVVVASLIARTLHLQHERRPLEVPDGDVFQTHDTLRAFLANGDTNSRGSLAPVPVSRKPGHIIAGGGGGEIVRGFYYRIAHDTVGTKQVVQRLCSRKFVRLNRVGIATELAAGVTNRLQTCFDSYSALSPSREDWLDLFYLHERFAHFAAFSARKQDAPRWLPFADIDLLELAWRLPAPLGVHCDIHRHLIRRFLPKRIYWMPLNGKHPPAWEGKGRLKRALREGAFVVGYARKRLSGRNKASALGTTAEGLFATAVYDYIYELLKSSGSIASTVLGPALVEKLLGDHRSRYNQLDTLGPLVNMEHYRRLHERAFERRLKV